MKTPFQRFPAREGLTPGTTCAKIPVVQSGAELLKAWIQRMKFTNVQAANYLGIPGVDDVVLNKVLRAGRRLELERLIIIEEKTGVPVRSWATTELDEPTAVGATKGKSKR